MYDYYCKNCNIIIGKWNNKYNYYYDFCYCNYIKLKKNYPIYFLDCKKCNKFIGIICYNVCDNCFGENVIFGEENLFNWFFKYKKIVPKDLSVCKSCNKNKFRWQYWFFEELTFYKQ